MIKTREAEENDLDNICLVHEAAWMLEHENIHNPELLEEVEQIFTSEKQKLRREKIRAAKLFPGRVFFRVAFIEEKLVGFLEAKRSTIQAGQPAVVAERLYVDPAYHGQGVGKALASDLLGWLFDGEKIEIIVASYNEKNRDLYAKYGFQENPHYIHDREDLPAIQMTRIVQKDLRKMVEN